MYRHEKWCKEVGKEGEKEGSWKFPFQFKIIDNIYVFINYLKSEENYLTVVISGWYERISLFYITDFYV